MTISGKKNLFEKTKLVGEPSSPSHPLSSISSFAVHLTSLMQRERDPFEEVHRFSAKLFTTEGKGAWTFAPLPKTVSPPVTGSWGMTPVLASVDGKSWKTTIWKDAKRKRTLLPVPKKIRGLKSDGDAVDVEIRLDRERILGPVHPLE